MNPEHTDDCLDLYADILVEDLTCQQESLHEVQIKYQEALRRIAILEKIAKQNETDIVSLKKKNTYLLKNISALYKTACMELERKKEIIESLRNQLASGFDYAENRIPAYPYNNMFEPQKIEDPGFNNGFVPYDNAGWEMQDQSLQFSDSHHYPSHSSHYPDNAVTASNTDTQNSHEGSHSPYSSSNMPNKEKSETHTSHSKPHNSHTAHVMESALTDNHTPPARNKSFHNNAKDSSSHASRSRYADEHTPHTKQTDSSASHSSRLSSRKHSGIKSTHSNHPRSKTPMSSHSDRRSSSTKRSHSDLRKLHSHTSEPRSSQSRLSEFKKSGHSSRIGSKDREPSSSSSSRSQHGQSRSSERGDTKSARSSYRSCSSDRKHQDSQSSKRGQNTSVKSCSDKGENLEASTKRKLPRETSTKRKFPRETSSKRRLPRETPTKRKFPRETPIKRKLPRETPTKRKLPRESSSKRKLPQEFSLSSGESKLKRRHKQKSTSREERVKRSSETEPHLTSCSGGGEEEEEEEGVGENIWEQKSELNTILLGETDKVNEEINEKENADLHDLRYDNVHESITTADQDTPAEMTGSPCPDGHTNITPQTATESQSLESMNRETDDATAIEQKSTSSTSENASQDSDVADAEDNAEKELNKCEELDTETNEPCNSVLWASKNLSDSDETASEVDKRESSSDTRSSSKKEEEEEEEEEQSGHSSDVSDKSDTSSDHRNKSIVIQCFGQVNSPIIIPCYPSKRSKSCSSTSDSEEDCNGESHLTSTPSKSLIARSLFPLNDSGDEESSKMGEAHDADNVKAKQKIAPTFDVSDNDTCSGKIISGQASEESPLLSVPATQSSKSCGNVDDDDDDDDNLDFVCSPILRKETEDLAVNTEGSNIIIRQNGEVNETSTSKKGDYCSESSSENDDGDNNNENCFHQIRVNRPLDENNACADDELEEGEILTDEENESVTVAALSTAANTTKRSPARHKSFSRLECRKSSGKRYREESRKKPREPMKSDPHNRQRLSPDHLVSKAHYPLDSGKHSRYQDGRNRVCSRGSESRSLSRHESSHHRQTGFHKRSSSNNTNGKRRTH